MIMYSEKTDIFGNAMTTFLEKADLYGEPVSKRQMYMKNGKNSKSRFQRNMAIIQDAYEGFFHRALELICIKELFPGYMKLDNSQITKEYSETLRKNEFAMYGKLKQSLNTAKNNK